MIQASEIADTVRVYLDRHPDETRRLAPLTTALAGSGDPTARTTFTGHVTCSALVLDPAARVLHIRHNALGRWLCPGGHLDAADTGLAAAAAREAVEETGIGALTLLDDLPVDIDVHTIPANPGRGEPEHPHFDLLYAFATGHDPVLRPQTEEVSVVAWVPVGDLAPAALRDKVAPIVRRAEVSSRCCTSTNGGVT
ncbi:NUDIX domain-containing protein [Plantactinospora sp. GCM10030261]|uniref:NUDIX domain-containing protein n=1 Tax=Plantactinospora sp. GCM10030261 TaxID=3273420 RepID=UPI00361E2844